VELAADLSALAASAVAEGCVGETLAAIQAAEQHARAIDPAVRAALATIADDEARHAELAWQSVAWSIARGGESVRRAVRTAFAEAVAGVRAAEPQSTRGLEAHGRLDADTQRQLLARALDDVVLPCAQALLGPHRPLAAQAALSA
jgi:hypothetical protein